MWKLEHQAQLRVPEHRRGRFLRPCAWEHRHRATNQGPKLDSGFRFRAQARLPSHGSGDPPWAFGNSAFSTHTRACAHTHTLLLRYMVWGQSHILSSGTNAE